MAELGQSTWRHQILSFTHLDKKSLKLMEMPLDWGS